MTGPSSERTADADAEMLRASITFMQGAFTRHKCYAALDRLVARNQQLEDQLAELPEIRAAELGWDGATTALERIEARNQQLQEALDRIASGDINWQACKAEACAALASVRARTP